MELELKYIKAFHSSSITTSYTIIIDIIGAVKTTNFRTVSHSQETFYLIRLSSVIFEEPRGNPCLPSPCGPYSNCRIRNDRPVCSCDAGYLGVPPNCRPECMVNSDCPLDKACYNQKCTDPCPGTCGINALCKVVLHSPICSCQAEFVGDPFTRCTPQESKICTYL